MDEYVREYRVCCPAEHKSTRVLFMACAERVDER